jgi:hypothetical protein
MPLISWSAFHEAHGQVFIIFADVEARAQTRFALLNRLAVVMQLKGAYAFHSEPGVIRLAFKRKSDAVKFAAIIQALKTGREGGWAGQWAFLFDDEVEEKIRAVLPAKPGRRPGASKREGRAVGRRRSPSA